MAKPISPGPTKPTPPAKLPTVSIADSRVSEGELADFLVTLSAPSNHDVRMNFVINSSAGDTATYGTDYNGATGTIVIPAGQTQYHLQTGVLRDGQVEGDETFSVKLSKATGATFADDSAVGTIIGDPPPPPPPPAQPVLNVTDGTIAEGAEGYTSGYITVGLDKSPTATVTYRLTVTEGSGPGQASIPEDASGSGIGGGTYDFTFEAGTQHLVHSIYYSAIDDTLVEGTETLSFNVSNITNATAGDTSGLLTINDNDVAPPPPTAGAQTVTLELSNYGGPVTEGNPGDSRSALLFQVVAITSDGKPLEKDVTFVFNTVDGTATGAETAASGADYGTFGQAGYDMFFLAGRESGVGWALNLGIFPDSTFEADETMTATISSPTNAVLGTSSVGGVILNDDFI